MPSQVSQSKEARQSERDRNRAGQGAGEREPGTNKGVDLYLECTQIQLALLQLGRFV